MNQYSILTHKRNQFKKQIRKQHHQRIFQEKRKIMLIHLQQLQNNQPIEEDQYEVKPSVNLIKLLQALDQSENISQNLQDLINILAKNQPFLYYNAQGQMPSIEEIQGFTIKIIDVVLNKIFYQFPNDCKKDTAHRLACINVIINLIADPLCSAQLILRPFIDHITYFYDSVEVYGKNSQTVEIGWALGNFLKRNVVGSGTENILGSFLGWVEQILQISEEDMLCNVYSSLSTFWQNFDSYYHRNHALQFPEKLKQHRISILETTIKHNIRNNFMSKILIQVQTYLQNNLELLYTVCHQNILICAFNNSLSLMGYISKKLQEVNCNLLINFTRKFIDRENYELGQKAQFSEVRFKMEKYNKRAGMAKSYLIRTSSSKILIQLTIHEVSIKIYYINLLLELISPSHNELMFEGKQIVDKFMADGLESVLLALIDIKNDIITMTCFHILYHILQVSQRQYGQRILHQIQNYHLKGDLAIKAAQLLENHQLQLDQQFV